ncbi:MAG: hypothetical protein RLZZ253_898 [Verrucomicrobiota bacterium]
MPPFCRIRSLVKVSLKTLGLAGVTEKIVVRWETLSARRKLTVQDSKDARAQVDEWRRRYGDTFARLTPEQLARCASVESRMCRVFGQ